MNCFANHRNATTMCYPGYYHPLISGAVSDDDDDENDDKNDDGYNHHLLTFVSMEMQ